MKAMILLAFFLSASAAMADVESMKKRAGKIVEFKDEGKIGEQSDGYLGVVKGPDDEAERLVREENADRKQEYEKRGPSQNQTGDALAAILGEARVRQEKPGRFVKENGAWVKK